MIRRYLTISLLLLGALANTIPRWLDFSIKHNRDIYYRDQAWSFFLWGLAIWIRRQDKYVRITITWCCGLALSNLMDELFFDPVHFGWNEVFFLILITSHAVYEITTNVKRSIN